MPAADAYGFDAQRKGIWKSKELEQEICTTFNTPHAQLVSSGTAALTIAMAALGIGAGDEIIMPTFTLGFLNSADEPIARRPRSCKTSKLAAS